MVGRYVLSPIHTTVKICFCEETTATEPQYHSSTVPLPQYHSSTEPLPQYHSTTSRKSKCRMPGYIRYDFFLQFGTFNSMLWRQYSAHRLANDLWNGSFSWSATGNGNLPFLRNYKTNLILLISWYHNVLCSPINPSAWHILTNESVTNWGKKVPPPYWWSDKKRSISLGIYVHLIINTKIVNVFWLSSFRSKTHEHNKKKVGV